MPSKRRVRVVTARDQDQPQETVSRVPKVIVTDNNPKVNRLTENEIRARKYATSSSMGGFSYRTGMDVIDSGTMQFYSPQLSTDFLEKPQNLRERRAFYRFFYNTNEIIGQAIDIHSTLPLSKIRLVPPKGKNRDQNQYVYKFFTDMCEEMKLFKTLIEITHEYMLFGNCVDSNSLIRTKLGYKCAKNIQVGDKVLTHKNRWKSVLKTLSRKSDNLLDIHCPGMPYSLRVTKEHPVEIIINDDGSTKFVEAGLLKEGDFIRIIFPKDNLIQDGSELSILENEYVHTLSDSEKTFVFSGDLKFISEKCIGVKIDKINTEEGALVYNFEVEEDHTYQVAGFSTHNCFIFAEEDDWRESVHPDDLSQKKQESIRRTEFLKEKYKIVDKNPLYKGWKKLLILPPDQVRVRKLPLTDEVALEYMPDPETRRFLTSDLPFDPNDPSRKIKYSISPELREKVRQSGMIPLDTDPYSGSHCFHLARKKSQYEPLGVSMIERCINTLVLMDKLRQAQTSIASRHMTPMRVVWGENLSVDDVDNLREQVDLALVDPDYSIIANYEIHWEEMGSNGRLLDVEAEMESSLSRLFAGLGITREVLTGEGTYTGSRISLEIMNTQYLLFRELLQDYVENYLFKPIAKKKGFVEYDDYGNEVLLYPRLSFTRLAIRDNDQFFDAAFQLYQKGSISIDLILDILNIDPDSTRAKIEQDLFTVNDSLFNELMRNIYTNVSTALAEQTNLTEKLAEYLHLEVKEEATGGEGESRFSSTLDDSRRKKLSKILTHLLKNPDKIDQIIRDSNKVASENGEKKCTVQFQK